MYVKKIVNIVFVTLLFLVLSSCLLMGINGSGIRVSESRNLSTFSKIDIDVVANINIELGSKQGVVIRGDDNLLKLIKTSVNNQTLIISSSEDYNSSIGINIDIIVNDLSSLQLDGVGDVKISNIKTSNLDLMLNGVGNIYVSGYASEVNLDLSGTGNFNLYNLISKNVNADLSGIGDIEIYVNDNLNADLSGIGSIIYRGSGNVISESNSGIGSIKKDN